MSRNTDIPHRLKRPIATEDALHQWVQRHLGLSVPRSPICPGHTAPFDYLWNAYREPTSEVIVWAPRGGGKTRLAAVATLLDLLHKPGIHVHILGGSLNQSKHVWRHLIEDLLTLQILSKAPGGDRIRLPNRSVVTILAHSQTSIRGQRTQKLRCDEVDLFKGDALEALAFTTRSITLRRRPPDDALALSSEDTPGEAASAASAEESIDVRGNIEMISTYHNITGPMSRLIAEAGPRGRRIIQWCLIDVLERCDQKRPCTGCPIWDECRGEARRAEGFFSIDDAIAIKRRSSEDSWQSEMLCRRPRQRGRVFPTFQRDLHVVNDLSDTVGGPMHQWETMLGIDFGYHAPFVCLWVQKRGEITYVLDEYLQTQQTVDVHIQAIAQRTQWGSVTRICCDPAGGSTNEQTARSTIDLLREHGYRIYRRHSHIADGLELIRAALKPAHGPVRLFINRRCKQLIEAMECYRYPDRGGETPLKDGTYDHPIDALRYWFINTVRRGKLEVARY